MRKSNRHISPFSGRTSDDFRVCRVLENCALIQIESSDHLRTAKARMRHVAAVVPGSYVVFSYRSKRILGKVVSDTAA